MRVWRVAVLLLLAAALPPTVAVAAPAKIALMAPSPPILTELGKTIGDMYVDGGVALIPVIR